MNFRAIGAGLVAVGIGIGALGSHALREVLTVRQLESLDTAVDYQLLNALALLVVGGWIRAGETHLQWPARLIVAGIIAFSGGIYLMLAGAPSVLGLVTPAGGVLLIAGWVLLAWRLFARR